MQLKLEEWMRYGLYPELLQLENYDEKRIYLDEITNSCLYKDILTISNIRYPEKLRQLLTLLAFQIGNLISIHELAINLQINRDTVINYLDLLEKSFVIFRLKGLSRNLRKEVTSMDKIYFFDLGVRNSIIENFNQLDFRNDKGALWENFIIVERIKRNEYQKSFADTYFWRTHTGAKLDFVEEKDGLLCGYELKWKSRRAKVPKTWSDTYANSTFQQVNKNNFIDFLT
jgi:predicted AAA+ superfamily ATPase